MIKSFNDIKHKGLRLLIEEGSGKLLPFEQIHKIKKIFSILTADSNLNSFNAFPGLMLHSLKGSMEGFWSVSVTGNYRIIFKFDGEYFYDIDYIDYH